MSNICLLSKLNSKFITFHGTLRTISTSSCVCGRRNPNAMRPEYQQRPGHPYDNRFEMSPKEVSPQKPWGSAELTRELGRKGSKVPKPPGYLDQKGRFVYVKEMEPEFVVPDLEGFKLKPYVSYRVSHVTQSEFTAKDLFDACYSKKVVDSYRAGKINTETDKTEDILQKIASKN